MSGVYPVNEQTILEVGSTPSEVVLEDESTTVETTLQETPVVVATYQPTVYTAGIQGPPGPPGPAGDEGVMYAKRVDFISDNLLYKGEAVPGSATSDAVWRIRRVTIGSDNDVTEEWANGSDAFTNIWDNRASLSYS